MTVLIIEDENAVARELSFMITELLKGQPHSLSVCSDLDEARQFLTKKSIDVLFLDLNLNGEDGFDLLHDETLKGVHIIITSAYKNRAIEAFDYGVLDFIPKPFERDRLTRAFERIKKAGRSGYGVKHFAIRKGVRIEMIEVDKVLYIKGSGAYSEIYLPGNQNEVHSKSLNKLEALLPAHFERVHKSYIANMNMATGFVTKEGSHYELILMGNVSIPFSRSLIKKMRERFI